MVLGVAEAVGVAGGEFDGSVGDGIVRTKNSDTSEVWINGYKLPSEAPDPDRLINAMKRRIHSENPYFWLPEYETGLLEHTKVLILLEWACTTMSLKECSGKVEQRFFNDRAYEVGALPEIAASMLGAAAGGKGRLVEIIEGLALESLHTRRR